MAHLRFRFDYEKCIQAIQFIATQKPDITQYYLGKVMFFADRAHLLDWGRPISGDRYVALEHGPVPSLTLDLIKGGGGLPDEIVDEFHRRITSKKNGNRFFYKAKENAPKIIDLSNSDKEYLSDAINTYGHMSFGDIKEISHKDIAYEQAWAKDGSNNEMDLSLWFNLDQLVELKESSSVYKRTAA